LGLRPFMPPSPQKGLEISEVVLIYL